MPRPDRGKLDEQVATRIREAREARGMTMMELAKEAGTTFQMIAHYEAGRSRPYFSRMITIARALGKSLGYFSGDNKR